MRLNLTDSQRKFLVLTEVLGTLHDIGKLADSKEVSDKNKPLNPYGTHVLSTYYEWFPNNIKKLKGYRESSDKIIYSQYWNYYNFDIIPKDLDKFSVLDKEMDTLIFHRKWRELALNGLEDMVQLNEEIGITSLRHHFGYRELVPNSTLTYIIAQADTLDSIEDRSAKTVYSRGVNKVSNSFGKELPIVNRDNQRLNLYSHLIKRHKDKSLLEKIVDVNGNNLEKIVEYRNEFNQIQEYMTKAAAMSIIPDNDTTVWDHCFVTGSLSKAMVRSILLANDKNLEIFNDIREFNLHKNDVVYLFLTDKELNERDIKKQLESKVDLANFCSFKYNGSFKNSKGKNIFAHLLHIRNGNKEIKKEKPKKLFKRKLNEMVDLDFGFFEVQASKQYVNFFKGAGAGWQDNRGDNAKVNVYDCLFGTPNILGVQYPGRDFRTQVYRMPDFIGRKAVLDEALKEVRNIIEVKYALGNCIYEDINGLYFLIPNIASNDLDVNLIEEVKEIFNNKFKGIISPRITTTPCENTSKTVNFGSAILKQKQEFEKSNKKRLSPYQLNNLGELQWTNEWEEVNNVGICALCGKMPATRKDERYEREKICSWCYNIREKGLPKNKEVTDNVETNKEKTARLLGHVMDDNNNMALIVGDFGLFDMWLKGDYVYTTINTKNNKKYSKSPSPSRLRSIIRNVNDYTSNIDKILEKDDLKGQLFEINLKTSSNKLSTGFWVHRFEENQLAKSVKNFIRDDEEKANVIKSRIMNRQNGIFKILVQEREEGQLYIESNSAFQNRYFSEAKLKLILNHYFSNNRRFDREKDINNRSSKSIDLSFNLTKKEISMAKKVYGLTDEFMFLVPAREAIDIVKELNSEFTDKFGKVAGRLSLNLGIIYARHKYPLYQILDAGKRMLKEFRESVHREENHQSLCKIHKTNIEEDESKTSQEIKTDGLETTIETLTEDEIKLRFNDALLIDEEVTIDMSKNQLDEFYSTWICIEDGEKKLKILPKLDGKGSDTIYSTIQEKDKVLYAPSIIDFQFLSTVKDRINIDLEINKEGHLKRDHVIKPLKLRPYLIEDFLKLARINDRINERGLKQSGLKKLETMFAQEIGRFCKNYQDWLDEQDKTFMDDIIDSMVPNISNLTNYYKDDGNVDEEARKEFYSLLKSGRFFDLMELRTFIDVFKDNSQESDNNE